MRLRRREARGWRLPVVAAAIVILLAPVTDAWGQDAAAPPPPDRIETARLVWTTLTALDQAGRTGNYSVLRDLAAPAFQRANDPARLAVIFAKLREQRLGLDRVVSIAPVYTGPPKVNEAGLYRITGNFPFRPYAIEFDMLFQLVGGDRRLFGISVARSSPMPPAKPANPGG